MYGPNLGISLVKIGGNPVVHVLWNPEYAACFSQIRKM